MSVHKHCARILHSAFVFPTCVVLFTPPIDVFFSLNGTVIHNNGLLNISDIGSTDNTALLCITNRSPPSGSTTGGNWFAPDGTRVEDIGSDDVPGFVRNRGPMVERLKRNTDTDPPDEGIYQCSVDDAESTSHSLYVGLYTMQWKGYTHATLYMQSQYFTFQVKSCYLHFLHTPPPMDPVLSSPSPVSPLVDLLPLSFGPETMLISLERKRLC